MYVTLLGNSNTCTDDSSDTGHHCSSTSSRPLVPLSPTITLLTLSSLIKEPPQKFPAHSRTASPFQAASPASAWRLSIKKPLCPYLLPCSGPYPSLSSNYILWSIITLTAWQPPQTRPPPPHTFTVPQLPIIKSSPTHPFLHSPRGAMLWNLWQNKIISAAFHWHTGKGLPKLFREIERPKTVLHVAITEWLLRKQPQPPLCPSQSQHYLLK